MSPQKPKESEVTILRMQLRRMGAQAVEVEKMKPPITIFCTDPENSSVDVRIEMDTDADGHLVVMEERGAISELPPRINVRITDAEKRSIDIPGEK